MEERKLLTETKHCTVWCHVTNFMTRDNLSSVLIKKQTCTAHWRITNVPISCMMCKCCLLACVLSTVTSLGVTDDPPSSSQLSALDSYRSRPRALWADTDMFRTLDGPNRLSGRRAAAKNVTTQKLYFVTMIRHSNRIIMPFIIFVVHLTMEMDWTNLN